VRKGDDLTTFTVAKVEKIWGPNLPDHQGPAQACKGKTTPFLPSISQCRKCELNLLFSVKYFAHGHCGCLLNFCITFR
jgi:hypothetical protein